MKYIKNQSDYGLTPNDIADLRELVETWKFHNRKGHHCYNEESEEASWGPGCPSWHVTFRSYLRHNNFKIDATTPTDWIMNVELDAKSYRYQSRPVHTPLVDAISPEFPKASESHENAAEDNNEPVVDDVTLADVIKRLDRIEKVLDNLANREYRATIKYRSVNSKW